MGLWPFGNRLRLWQIGQVAGENHLTLIAVNEINEFLISYQKLCIGITHHEFEAFLGIRRVEWLIGTSGLEHT